MEIMPMLFVSDMKRSLAFYTALDESFSVQAESEMWSEIRIGEGAVLALHGARSVPEYRAGRMELNFTTTEVLEEVLKRLAGAGITPDGGIIEEDFGRLVVLRDPDGLPVKLNELAQ